MTIDMGLDDPEAMEALTRAIRIVDESVDSLREDIGAIRYCDDSEVCRLAHALPSGPLSLDHSIVVAAEAARGALDQISWTVRNHAPTSMIVLHALLRAALVGSARVVFVLLPSDPSVRLQNARVLLAQEGRSFAQALDSYAKFDRLASLRPDEEYLKTARE